MYAIKSYYDSTAELDGILSSNMYTMPNANPVNAAASNVAVSDEAHPNNSASSTILSPHCRVTLDTITAQIAKFQQVRARITRCVCVTTSNT